MVWVFGGSPVLRQGFGPPKCPPRRLHPPARGRAAQGPGAGAAPAPRRRRPRPAGGCPTPPKTPKTNPKRGSGRDPDPAVPPQEPSCGRSPLHLAVEAQSPEVAECLLRGGARPDPRTFSGFTPLYSARRRPDPRLPPLLRRFGARDPPSSDSSDSGDSGGEGGAEDSEVSAGPLPPCPPHRDPPRGRAGGSATVPRPSRAPPDSPNSPQISVPSPGRVRRHRHQQPALPGLRAPPEPPRMDSGCPCHPQPGGPPGSPRGWGGWGEIKQRLQKTWL